MPAADWIAAEEARDRLGVRPQTLYAYVSRGRVQVRPDPVDPRRSLYRSADIAALAQRKARSRKVSDVATGAIAWGEPVLASEITTIAGGRLFYRGRDAIRLAETETLESVARLLRGGHGAALKRTERPAPPEHPDMRSRAYLALAARAGSDPPARGRHPLALAVEAATLLDVLTDAVAGNIGGGAIHNRLALAWGLGPGGADADLIRRILVLVPTMSSMLRPSLRGWRPPPGPRSRPARWRVSPPSQAPATAAPPPRCAPSPPKPPSSARAPPSPTASSRTAACRASATCSIPTTTPARPTCWNGSSRRRSCRRCAARSRPSPAWRPTSTSP